MATPHLNKASSPGGGRAGGQGAGAGGRPAEVPAVSLMRWFGYGIQTPTCHRPHTSRGAEVFIGASDHLEGRGTFHLGMGPLGSWQD